MLELKKLPNTPEFNNSAGRILSLLQMLPSNTDYFSTIVGFYGFKADAPPELKGRAYLSFMSLVGKGFDEFIQDIENSPRIPEVSRKIIKEGLSELIHCAFPSSPNNAPRKLEGAEIALLRMAASMLEEEPKLEESDLETIRTSIDELRKELENSDLKKSAREALLELARLSRNALDYYAIHGARGFKDVFKKMLAELMEVYLHEGKEVTKESWWKAAVSHVSKIDNIAGRLLKYKPLLANAAQLFLGGP
jgi:hypothetical protein